jgi:hypothetical protein
MNQHKIETGVKYIDKQSTRGNLERVEQPAEMRGHEQRRAMVGVDQQQRAQNRRVVAGHAVLTTPHHITICAM